MTVLVTGGAGFIGSHIVEALLAEGIGVRVVDITPPSERSASPDHPTASPPDGRASPERSAPSAQGVEWIEGDLCDPAVAARAVAGVDAVCHQASKVGLGVDFGDVTGYVSNNDLGTAVLLEALWRRCFRGRLVLAGSMVVYGEGRSECPRHGRVAPGPRRVEDLQAGRFEPPCPVAGCDERVRWAPVDEEAPADPRNVYAATKLHQEHLCAAWGRETGAAVVALRYHNVYGPRMPLDTPYAGVAAIFRSALAAGRAPQVFEDGGQTRDFVHVRDVARANVLALTAAVTASGAYNVASGSPHTVADMAGALADAFGRSAARPQVTGGWRLGDVRHIVASPRKAAEELGFVAEVDFADGMAELAAGAPGEAGRPGGAHGPGAAGEAGRPGRLDAAGGATDRR